jgi:hypothetical protein
MRPLLCLGRCRLRPGPFRLGLLGGHITQRGGLVLLGLAFFRQRFVAAYGPDRFLGSTLHLFRYAFDPCLRSGLIRRGRLPLFPSGASRSALGTARYPATWDTNAARPSRPRGRIYPSFSVCSGQVTQRVRMVMPPWGRPPAKAAVRTQKWDHMLSWISLARRSLL